MHHARWSNCLLNSFIRLFIHLVVGGYQYRLCPATEDLTEECSQKYPLEFATDFTAAVVAAATTVGKSTVVGGGGLLV